MKRNQIIGVVVIFIVIIVIIVIIAGSLKNKNEVIITPGGEKPNIVQDVLGFFTNLFKPKPKKYCDCDKPGYNVSGQTDSLCNEGNMLYETDCL